MDWINVTNNSSLTTLAKGDGTTDDTKAIQGALNAASPGEVVYLPGPTAGSTVVGKYLVSAPLVVPSGVILSGCSPAGELASGFTGMHGTILKVASNWSSSNSGLNNPGVIAFNGASSGVYNVVVKDLWIDFTSGPAPASVNGIASYDSVFHAVIDRIGIVAATGIGIYGQNNGSSGRPDGWSITNVIVEQPALDGVRYEGQDSFLANVHAQNGNSNSGTGDGFVIAGGNNRLVGCRADSCTNGFTIDVRQNGVFSGSTTLVGCGTEENSQNGLNVINSSSSSTAMSDPIIATGSSFDGDGVSGISVTGANIVILHACNVNVTSINGPTPQYALSLAASASGSIPNLVQALGGWWTAASSTLVHGSANANVLSYGVHGFKGGQFVNGDAISTFSVNSL